MVALAVAAVLAVAAPGCRTIAVAASIQAAVDEAQPCDWVLVPPGLYEESVVVSTICSVHNLSGKIYLFFIVPFHRTGVQSLLANAVAAKRL